MSVESVDFVEPDEPDSRTLNATDEPFYGDQWHLSSTLGFDINIHAVWEDYTGAGITVVVVDEGTDPTHPDLDDNLDPVNQIDSRNGDIGPGEGEPKGNADKHGTAVAGVIAAEDNDIGVVGVTYDATLIAAYTPLSGDADEFAGLGYGVNFDVVNNSWGWNPGAFNPFPDNFLNQNSGGGVDASFYEYGLQLEGNSQDGRGGLGTVYVFAAGNGGQSDDVNQLSFQSSRFTIAVGATQESGETANFSTPGAAALLSAPGVDIATTDRVGSPGWNSGPGGDEDYAILDGTSFASPIVAGITALMLEANGDLGVRDIQEIFALSSRTIDPQENQWQTNGANCWNGGGLTWSNNYGSGLVDAHAAVRLAETWFQDELFGTGSAIAATFNNETVAVHADSPGSTIPDNQSSGLTETAVITDDFEVDQVSVYINIEHGSYRDLSIELTSPSGTTATLFDRPFGFGDDIEFVFGSTIFWGEMSVSTWSLKVEDHDSGDVGTLLDWTLSIYGDNHGADDTFIYTNEFGDAFKDDDSARRTLSDDGGTDTINVSAIDLEGQENSIINLLSGENSAIAGRTLTIGTNTTIENVIAGEGNDIITGNSSDNNLFGGRGTDWFEGGAGNDLIFGGRGIDTAFYGNAGGGVTVDLGITDFQSIGGGQGFDALRDIEYLIGSDHNDTLKGSASDNVLKGGAGDDFLRGREGIDTARYDDALAGVSIDLANKKYQVVSSDQGSDRFSDIENLLGSIFDDSLRGSDDGNVLDGGLGNDLIEGRGGHDLLDGGSGDDTLLGGQGRDTYDGGSGIDTAVFEDATRGVLVDLEISGIQAIRGGLGSGAFIDIEQLVVSSFDDILTGSAGDNHLDGGDGNDTLNGGGGDDTLVGGEGDALLEGGEGDDLLVGGAGRDKLFGGSDTDTADYSAATSGLLIDLNDTGPQAVGGNLGNDRLRDVEHLIGGNHNDILKGTNGDDTLQGGAGDDILNGRDGNDTASFDDAVGALVVDLQNTGFQNVGGGLGADRIRNIERLIGGGQNDTLKGTTGDDTIEGGNGDDFLHGRSGNDELHGGGGDDSILGLSGADELHGEAGDGTLDGGENDDILNGGAGNDFLDGDTGNDTLHGGDGNDTLDGDIGRDELHGGDDDDSILGGSGADELHGGTGDDTLDGGTGTDVLSGDAGNDILDPGDGTDTLDYSGSANAVAVNLNAGTATGEGSDTFSGIENIIGSAHHDTLTGDGGGNVIDDGENDDILNGGAGNDTLDGENGDDTIDGGAGNDAIDGGNDRDELHGGTGDDTLNGGSGTDVLSGDAGFNVIDGGDNNDILNGGGGHDFLDGETGDDTIDGGDGDDVLNGGAGNDTLDGGTGDDTIDGGNNNDILNGGGGNDILDGGAGDDTIDGDAGYDSAKGGFGDDVFVYRDGDGNDVLEDFGFGNDLIDLSALTDIVNFTDLIDNHASNDGSGNLDIVYGTGSIRLLGVENADLSASDFIF
ncbi:MAG: S8 family serine peptidase [Alphaproteobacteria bacterium]|nr:S8 family serine peptidase [Alphaproteobacteria bacterium]